MIITKEDLSLRRRTYSTKHDILYMMGQTLCRFVKYLLRTCSAPLMSIIVCKDGLRCSCSPGLAGLLGLGGTAAASDAQAPINLFGCARLNKRFLRPQVRSTWQLQVDLDSNLPSDWLLHILHTHLLSGRRNMSGNPLLTPIFPAGKEPLPPGVTEEEREAYNQGKKYQQYMSMGMESCVAKTILAGGMGMLSPFSTVLVSATF